MLFVNALRRGEFLIEKGLDPIEMVQQKKDEEQFALGIGKHGDVEDRIFKGRNPVNVCPTCGTTLIEEGKCPACRD